MRASGRLSNSHSDSCRRLGHAHLLILPTYPPTYLPKHLPTHLYSALPTLLLGQLHTGSSESADTTISDARLPAEPW